MRLNRLLIISALLTSHWSYSQTEIGSEEVVELRTQSGIRHVGSIIFEDDLATRLVKLSGDTVLIYNHDLKKKIEFPKNVILYPKSRFHYNTGYHLDINQGIGFGGNGAISFIDISINKRMTPKFTLGVGIGSQNIFSSLQVSGGATSLDLTITNGNTPVFVQSKYYLNKKRRRMYAHSRMGYTIGRGTEFNASESHDGFLASYGIGFTKATKRRLKTFFQISQTHNFSSGTALNNDLNGVSTIDYDIWFNRVTLSWGLEFNLAPKIKRTKYR